VKGTPFKRSTSRLASFFPSIRSKITLSPMATSENSERVSCIVDECNTTFSRQADMERHVAEHHGPMKRCHLPDCPWEGARRSARVQEHMKKAHPEIYDVQLNVPSQFGASSLPMPLQQDVNQELRTTEPHPAILGSSSPHHLSATGSEISNPVQFAHSSTPTSPWPSFATEPYHTFNETLAPQLQIPMALSEEDYQAMVQPFQTATSSPQPTHSAGGSNLPAEDGSLVESEETMETQRSYSWSG